VAPCATVSPPTALPRSAFPKSLISALKRIACRPRTCDRQWWLVATRLGRPTGVEGQQVPKDAFVIMPFSATPNHSDEDWKTAYDYVIAPAITNAGYSCSRAAPERGSLIGSIVEKLHSSWLVVADLTDRNANVFYELVFAMPLAKEPYFYRKWIQMFPLTCTATDILDMD
jgi:hypothetical protein